MTTLTAKSAMHSAMNYTNVNKKGLWPRFKNYLAENQQIITTGMAIMNGTSYYVYSKVLGK